MDLVNFTAREYSSYIELGLQIRLSSICPPVRTIALNPTRYAGFSRADRTDRTDLTYRRLTDFRYAVC